MRKTRKKINNIMRTITEIKELIKNSTAEDNLWKFKPNLTKTQLLELREVVEDGLKHQKEQGKINDFDWWRETISKRACGCLIDSIKIALRNLGELDEPVFAQGQEEYDKTGQYNFKYDRLEAEKEKEFFADARWEMENMEYEEPQARIQQPNK